MAAEPPNIAAFNRTAAVLLSDLYEQFPVPQQVNADELGKRAASAEPGHEGTTDHSAVSLHTITWLASEGFIAFQSQAYGGTFLGVRLTIKGFTVLGQVPAGVKPHEPQETFAGRLKRAVTKGAESAVSDAVKSLFAQAWAAGLQLGVTS